MQENLKRNLNLFLPRLFTLKYGWQCFWGVCAYTLVMLNFQHPFGEYTSNRPHHHCIFCSFGCLFILLLLLIYHVLPRVFKSYYHQSNWTRGKELSNLLLLYILCCLSNWACALLTFSPAYHTLTFCVQIVSFSFLFNVLPVIVANLIHARFYRNPGNEIAEQKQPIESIDLFHCVNKKTIPIKDILYFYQAANYQFIHYVSEGEVVEEKKRRSMKELLNIMAPYTQFMPCHASYLVNSTKIESISNENGKKKLKIKDVDTYINISNNHRNDFNSFMQSKK